MQKWVGYFLRAFYKDIQIIRNINSERFMIHIPYPKSYEDENNVLFICHKFQEHKTDKIEIDMDPMYNKLKQIQLVIPSWLIISYIYL